MKITKYIAVFAIIGATSLFSTEVKQISMLVDKINNTKNHKVQDKLIDELENECSKVEKEDRITAQAIIREKLTTSD
ncbi:MAG: hypothetical protein K8R39_08130 [Arcobacteraceae bacterium]|nr:hypothetical protein [Arcobacteraceae bacterium]